MKIIWWNIFLLFSFNMNNNMLKMIFDWNWYAWGFTWEKNDLLKIHFELVTIKKKILRFRYPFLLASHKHRTSNKSTDQRSMIHEEIPKLNFLRSDRTSVSTTTAQQCEYHDIKGKKSESFMHACFNTLRIALWPQSIRKW